MHLRNVTKVDYKSLHEGEPVKFENKKKSVRTSVLDDLYEVERIIFSRRNQGVSKKK